MTTTLFFGFSLGSILLCCGPGWTKLLSKTVCVCVCVWVSSFDFNCNIQLFMSFPDGSDCKESVYSAGDLDLIPGLGRSPEEGNGYPLQYSCLENSMDGRVWQATVHGVTKSCT